MRISALLFLILHLFLVTSCDTQLKRFPKPDRLIEQDKMVLILHDLMLLEGHIQGQYPEITQFHRSIKKSGEQLFKKYKISSDEFDASMDYYGSRQDEMTQIYEQVLEKFTVEMNELETKQQVKTISN
jgi:hypothetical protein